MTSTIVTDDDTRHDLTKMTMTVRWLVSRCFEPDYTVMMTVMSDGSNDLEQ